MCLQNIPNLHLRIPDELLKWIDDTRGSRSRAAYIVYTLKQIRNNTKLYQHKDSNYDGEISKGTQQTT